MAMKSAKRTMRRAEEAIARLRRSGTSKFGLSADDWLAMARGEADRLPIVPDVSRPRFPKLKLITPKQR